MMNVACNTAHSTADCVITYKGVTHVFKRLSVKMCPRMFNDYCWFIVKATNSTNKSDVPIESLAMAWVYKKYLGVEYDKDIEAAFTRTL